MGFIHEDPIEGVHIESRRESLILFTDYGHESIELEYEKWEKIIPAIKEILENKK